MNASAAIEAYANTSPIRLYSVGAACTGIAEALNARPVVDGDLAKWAKTPGATTAWR